MKARAGRPPKAPTGTTATITLRIASEIKTMMMEQSDALDLSLGEYLSTLVRRDAEGQ